ncbi:MAG: pyridoxal-dependent decarboxylase [Candidatus Limnocylindrales bacterium]
MPNGGDEPQMKDQRDGLDEAQRTATGDMPAAELRAALHAAADLVADYLEHVEEYAVLPPVRPGQLRARLDGPPPEDPQPLEAIMRDVAAEVVPNVTHWQSPNNMAYFGSNASAIGILGELVSSALNANAFTWRVSPVGSELEGITVDWLREGFGLPDTFDGVFNDTASMSTLSGLACARQRATGNASQSGLGEAPRLRFYTSGQAHSSVERAAMILGLGRDGVRKVELDEALAMRPAALAAAIAEDRAAGWTPAGIVATIGTTGTTAIDPVAAVAEVAAAEHLWLHVDAAYAGPVALIPEMRHLFSGWERADSIVVNPHKWMFTPFDCSLLLTRDMATLRDALSLVPEYLRTYDGRDSGRDYSEYVPQLGRKARGIKMWMQLRYFGLSGLRARLQEHIDLAHELAGWIDADPDAQRLFDVPFGTVCFRMRPRRYAGREGEPVVAAALDALNEAVMNRANDSGRLFLSHTKIDDAFILRLVVGNIRTERRHLRDAWSRLQATARVLDGGSA